MKFFKYPCHWATLVAVLSLALLADSCHRRQAPTSSFKVAEVISGKTTETVHIGCDSLDSVFRGLRSDIFKFYKSRTCQPAWYKGNALNPAGDSLYHFVQNLAYYGLNPGNYHFSEMTGLSSKRDANFFLQRMDVLLTDAFLSLAKDVRYGATSGQRVDSIQMQLLQRAVLEQSPVKILRSQESVRQGYRLLKEMLRKSLDSLNQNKVLLKDSLFRRISTISVNLERWRLERARFSGKYIFINIPAFLLDVVSADTFTFESRVIVGTPDNPTPVLSSEIDCFITYPYWHVPRKIAVEEFLPQIQKNISFISRNNFDVLDRRGNILNPDSVKWSTFNKDYFPVSLRQREGTDNSLGILKFVFDNPYAVYLHDTNAKRLFRNPVRAYSHGCIRMERAEDFGHYLITGDVNVKSKWLTKFLKEKEKHYIELKHSLPIYVRYFTCEVRNEQLFFYSDIYHQDQILLNKLKLTSSTTFSNGNY